MSVAALPTPARETLSQRVQRLQAEARILASDHVQTLSAALVELEQLASEIAEGGEAYPVGVRELARTLVAEVDSRLRTLDALIARARQ